MIAAINTQTVVATKHAVRSWALARPVVLLSLLLGLCVIPVHAAQEPVRGSAGPVPAASNAPPSGASSAVGANLSAADLGAYFDAIIPHAMKKGDIAGGAVVVVEGDQVLFEKGYGYANIAAGTRFDANTLFRPGSISKLFTWTAIMQLVEQGRVRLDDDVNDYLDTKVANGCGRITIRDLLTHTPGFEETIKNIYFHAPRKPVPIGEYLSRDPAPRCLFKPGTVIAYSNYGATLAGHIVERVSGMTFGEYVQRFIFQPLGMLHSTFQQPLPEALEALAAAGYSTPHEGARPEEVIQAVPAGGLWSSPADIARFMIAQLNGGVYDGRRILQAATIRLMQSHQISTAAGFNGFALGFYEMSRNGHRVVSHAGDTRFFHSDLDLLPAQRVGILATFNSTGTDDAANALLKTIYRGFMDRYFPSSSATPAGPLWPDRDRDALRVAGLYIASRRNENTFLRLTNIFRPGAEYAIRAAPDGALVTQAFVGADGKPEHWRETGPLLYRATTSPDRMKFLVDGSGKIELMTTDADIPVYVSQPVRWSEDVRWILPLLEAVLGTFLLVALIQLALSLPPMAGRVEHGGASFRWSDVVVAIWSALNIGLTSAWHHLIMGPRLSPSFSDSLDPWLITLYLLGWVSVACAIYALWHAWRSVRAPRRCVVLRTSACCAAVAGVAFVAFLADFHLLDFALSY